ncbi:hypothetical protein K523DRAFT_21478 [Schizophyllum commune Tattone D]|nr:hypothetical protein K523DRAFT_21478 [Schizophyllum commune Tattone D]
MAFRGSSEFDLGAAENDISTRQQGSIDAATETISAGQQIRSRHRHVQSQRRNKCRLLRTAAIRCEVWYGFFFVLPSLVGLATRAPSYALIGRHPMAEFQSSDPACAGVAPPTIRTCAPLAPPRTPLSPPSVCASWPWWVPLARACYLTSSSSAMCRVYGICYPASNPIERDSPTKGIWRAQHSEDSPPSKHSAV